MDKRTLGDLRAFKDFVVDGTGALLDELVALNADVEDLGALDAKLDELLHRRIDNISRGLQSFGSKRFVRIGDINVNRSIRVQRQYEAMKDLVFGEIGLRGRARRLLDLLCLLWLGSVGHSCVDERV